MGRDQGYTAWELEAARRREILASSAQRAERTRARDGDRGGIRLPSWMATLGRATKAAAPERDVDCRPRVPAARPGS